MAHAAGDSLHLPARRFLLAELGYPILILTLIQAVIASLLLVLLPLRYVKTRPRGAAINPTAGASFGYFLATIGLAYLFIEMAFIQKFAFFLGHPHAVAVVIAGF